MTADFDYKKYSLEHLENWLHDALNCEDLTPQDIYESITNAVDENIEHHKKYLTKNIEFLSLLKGHRQIDFGDVMKEREYYEGWEGYDDFESPLPTQYTEEELDAMCEAAAEQEEKDKCREYNLREAEYYNKRAKLDAEYEAIKAVGGYEWTPQNNSKSKTYWDLGRNKTYDQMIAEGYTMTDDGFWIKES